MSQHIIDTYMCIDALISVIEPKGANSGVEHSANVYPQGEHYASNSGSDLECFDEEMMIMGNNKALIEVY
ncbi:MAG: hypothetical protein EOP33_03270 [Rickettsiaceae bacterium]|nr:MAG: hypothetical protein EOP33_03270 [Rickettsiaceae bacterium]